MRVNNITLITVLALAVLPVKADSVKVVWDSLYVQPDLSKVDQWYDQMEDCTGIDDNPPTIQVIDKPGEFCRNGVEENFSICKPFRKGSELFLLGDAAISEWAWKHIFLHWLTRSNQHKPMHTPVDAWNCQYQ